jgi:AcrR family transcriptional regulator
LLERGTRRATRASRVVCFLRLDRSGSDCGHYHNLLIKKQAFFRKVTGTAKPVVGMATRQYFFRTSARAGTGGTSMEAGRPGEDTLRRPRRTQADRRETAERRLLDAAIRLIAERGIKGTTLGDVGEAAGYSRGLTAHHYKTKEGLVRAVVAEIHRRFGQRVAAASPPTPAEGLKRILAAITVYLDVGVDVPAARALHLIQKEALTTQSEFRGIMRKFNRLSVGALEKQIRIGIAAGEIRPEVDPTAQAVLLLASLRGARAQWLLAPEDVDMASVTAALVSHVKRAMAA